MAVPLPERIGRYDILTRLATGGMAEILLGRLTGVSGFERPVVVKRILPNFAEQTSFRSMFLDEARIAARIHHSNVVQHFDLGEADGELFLVMEYLDGEPLSNVRRRALGRNLELGDAVVAHIIAEAAAGLEAAHELVGPDGSPEEVVHRDVSPDNLFITYDGHVKLIDFGIAKASDRITRTETGTIKGKFEYLSPEQATGGEVDRRSDVFSLGIVLHELLTGHRLFKRGTTAGSLRAVLEDAIPPPRRIRSSCPESLELVCMRALERDRDRRFQTARELRHAVLVAARGLAETALPEETLRARMHELFETRIEERRELSRRIKEQLPIESQPTTGVELLPELPTVEEHLGPRDVRRPRSRFVAAGVLLTAAVAGVAALLWSEMRPGTATATGAGETPPTEHAIRVDSTPAGARLRVGGVDRGVTPTTLGLPPSERAMSATLELAGYEVHRFEIIPDRDQRVSVALTAEPPRAVAAPAVATPESTKRRVRQPRPPTSAETDPAEPERSTDWSRARF